MRHLNLIPKVGPRILLHLGLQPKVSEIAKVLLNKVKSLNIPISTNSEVISITKLPDKKFTITVNKKGLVGNRDTQRIQIKADKIVLATGGKSYPKTGSTGAGFKLASQLGHTITPVSPSLVPIETKGNTAKKLQGLSLKTVIAKLGFHTVSKKDAEREEREIATLLKDTVDELIQLKDDGEITEAAYDWLIHKYSQANSQLLTDLGVLVQEHGFIPREEYTYAVKETLEVKKEAVKESWEKKLITGKVGERLLLEIEAQISILAIETDATSLKMPVDLLKSVTAPARSNSARADIERSCAICMGLIEPGESTNKC